MPRQSTKANAVSATKTPAVSHDPVFSNSLIARIRSNGEKDVEISRSFANVFNTSRLRMSGS